MKIKKNKFIIGLSTTLLGSVIAAGGEVAHASALPEQTDLTPTNDIVENVVDDYNKVIDDSEELDQLTEDNKDLEDTKVDEVPKEESAQSSDLSETAQSDAKDENKADTTNETEEADTTTNTVEGTNSASETTNDEEDVLAEPSNTTEPPTEGDKAVENPAEEKTEVPAEEDTKIESEEPVAKTLAEENTSIDTDAPQTQADQNPDTAVEAGGDSEDGDDPASTEVADKAQAGSEKAEELAVTETVDKALDAQANTPNYPSVEEGAPLDGVSATAAAGPTPYAAATGEATQSETPDYKKDAESLLKKEDGYVRRKDGEEVDDSFYFIPVDTVDPDKLSDPLYKENQRHLVEHRDSKYGIDLTLGFGDVTNKYYAEGVKIRVLDPSESKPGDVYELDILIDTEESGRAISFLTIIDEFDMKKFKDGKNNVPSSSFFIDPIKEGETTYSKEVVTDMPDGFHISSIKDKPIPITLVDISKPHDFIIVAEAGRGVPDRRIKYNFTDEFLKTINSKDAAVFGFRGKYLRVINDDDRSSHIFTSPTFEVSYSVVPFPNENKNGGLITLNTDDIYEFEKEIKPVQNQVIDTGIKVNNLLTHDSFTFNDEDGNEVTIEGYNDASRLVGQAYDKDGNPLKDVRVYYEDDQVKIELPKGALENNDSVFNRIDGPYRNYRDLNIELFMAPRTEDQLKVEVLEYNSEATNLNQDKFARYNTYNKVGKFTLNIDDKSNYQIGFSKDETNADGTIKKVDETYTLKELTAGKEYEIDTSSNHEINKALFKDAFVAAEKGEVKMTLDQGDIKKLQDKGWTVTTSADADPAGGYSLGDIVVRPPLDAEIGDEGILRAYYDFTNGSRQTFILPYRVTAEGIEKPHYDHQTIDLKYIEKDGERFEDVEANKTTSDKILDETTAKATPSSYALKSQTIRDKNGKEWTFEIDNGGEITATPPSNLVESSTVEVPVELTYEDKVNIDGKEITREFTREVTAKFTAIPDENGFVYYTEDVKEFETVIEYSADLKPGESEITKEGKLGKTRTKHRVTTENGTTVDEPVGKPEVIVEAQDQIITVGLPNSDKEEQVVDIPFNTEYIYDNTLPAGTTKTDKEGVAGYKKLVTTYDEAKEIFVTEVVEEKAPENKIVRIGGKTTGTQYITEDIAFDIKVEYDSSLKKGEWKYKVVDGVEQKGVAGVRTITVDIENSVPTRTDETFKAPVDAVVLVGDEDFTGSIDHKETFEIPYTIEVRKNSELAAGETRLVQQGQAGSCEIKYVHNIKNGAADGDVEETRTDIKAAVPHIIEVGTKPAEVDPYRPNFEVGSEVEFVYDPTLNKGVTEKGELVPGKVETKLVTVTDPVTGETKTEEQIVTTPAKQQIIVGTKDYTGTFTHTEEQITPYRTEIRYDASLAAGEQRTTQEGRDGKQTRTVTQSFTNGEIGEKSYSDWNVDTTVQNEIITVGTMTEGTHKHTEELPFNYVVEYDPSIKAGEYKIEKPGVVGTKTTTWTVNNSQVVGDPTTSITPAQDAVIKVGNKDFVGEVKHTEEFAIPYTVEIRYNPELPVGTTNVTQEGKAGSYKVTYTQNIKNGETTGELNKTVSDRVEAQNQIIEVGSKPVDPTTNTSISEVNPVIHYVYRDDLDKGVVQQGKTTPGEVKTVIITTRDPETGQLVTKEEKVVNPPRQEIIVGTKNFTGEYKYTEEKVDEYKTRVVFDDTLAPGEEVIETPGVNGVSKREVTVQITNGTAGTPSYGDYQVSTPRQDQVIRVGTKTDGKHRVTEEIPFGYTIEEVDTLAKGEYKEVTPGKLGSKTTEYEILNSKVVDGSATVVEKTNPVNAVIQVGKGTLNGTHTITENEVVPYETEIVFDNNLKAGDEVVVNEGTNGSKSRQVTLTIEDGKVVATDEGEYTENSAPVNRIVRVGTLTEGTITHEEKIPFSYEITYDPTVEAGTYVTDVEGVEGTRTTTWTITNSTPVKTSEVTNGPTNAKIRVGTKDFTGTVTNTTTEPIPYKVIVRENPDMLLGTSRTVTDGVAGSKEVTYNIPVKNGEQDTTKEVTSSEKVTQEPVDQVIEVGTKAVDPVTENVSEDVEVVVEYKFDPELPKGERRTGELVPGKVENVVTTVYNPQTGQMETREDKKVTPAVQTIYIGSKDLTGPYSYEVEKDVPFTTIYELDPTLDAGVEQVSQVGENGTKVITVTSDLVNGKAENSKIEENITKEPKPQIIKVGTKVKPGENTTTDTRETKTSEKELIQFDIEYRKTDELKAGETRVVQEGVFGERTVTTHTKVVNGETVVDKSSEVTKDPVKQIVEIGTGVDEANVTDGNISNDPIKIEIPFKTKEIEDPNLEAGQREVVRDGVDGERTITVTVPVKDGVAGEPIVSDEVTTQPKEAIVRVGTKKSTTRTEIKETPVAFETEIVYDPEMAEGTSKVTQAGENGIDTTTTVIPVVNGVDQEGSTSTERTKDPVKQIITVGTKKATQNGTHTHVEEIPFEVEIIPDPTLLDGEYEVDQEGKAGSITTTWTIVDSKVDDTQTKTERVEPTNAIIRVGTADHTGTAEYTTKEETPFTVRIVENPSLAIGKRNVLQEGKAGSKEYKYVIDIVNGKQAGETRRVESHITDPVEHIIEVGTKQVPNDNIAVEKSIVTDFEVIYDDTKDKGYVEISDPVPGKVETRIVEVFNPETGEIETTTEEVVVTNPKQTITIGTKDLEGSQSTEVTKVVPFETEYIYDDTLASGERVVDQEGSNGEMIVTYTTKVKNGSAYDTTVTENITTEPTKQIVRIGTKEKIVDTKTEVVKESIPFETEYKYDDTLAAGTYEVDEEGKLGEKTTTTTTTIINGESTSNTNEETTKDPVNRVVRIGTKIDRETKDVVSTNTYEIPFETKVTYDPNLKAGEEIVKVEGENGSRTVTVTVPVVEGKAGEPVVEDKVTKAPTTREVVIGTKDNSTNTSTVISVTREEIPFEIEYVKDDTLAAGETRVETVGKNGKKITTTTLVNENGKSETKIEETTEDAVKQVVRVGTKVEDKKLDNQDFEKKFTQEIPFATEIEYDENLAAGTEKVVQDGKNGSREITVKVRVRDGIASEPVVTDNITPATPKIIKIGTMTTDTVTTVTETVKPFETEIVYDNTMDKGTSKVTQNGVNGKEIKTTVTTVINGKAQENPVVTTSSTEPTKQIITVGTKCPDSTTTVDTVVEKVTPYDVKIIYDDTLDKGTETVDTEGRVGIVRETHTVEVKNGVAGESKITKTETIQEKQDKVIRIGTKPTTPTTPETPKEDSNDIVSVTEVPEQFETDIIYDDTLPAGKVVEEQKGINGVRTITTTIKITDGKAKSIVTEEVTKEAQKRIIRVGTKTATNNDPIINEKIVEIPFEPIETYDPNLEEGKARVIRPGQKGEKTITTITKIVDGKEVTEVIEVITKQPVDEIRIVGTKVTIKNPVAPKPSDDSIVDNPVAPKPSEDDSIVDIPVVPEQGEDNKTEIPGINSKDEDNIDISTEEDDIDDVKTPGIDETERVTEDDNEDSLTEVNEDQVDENIGVISKDKDSEVDRIGVSGEYEKTDKEKEDGSQYFINENEPDIPRTSNKSDNPKTGITGTSSVLTALGISIAGFAASKKKKEDDKE